jgi:hypothetical protein
VEWYPVNVVANRTVKEGVVEGFLYLETPMWGGKILLADDILLRKL